MSKPMCLILGMISAAFASWLWQGVGATQAAATEVQRWQYKVVGDAGSLSEQELQRLGEEGWELVLVDREGSFAAAFYFKKPR